ncbi:Tim44 domain-containing protein [Rhizobium herbae]|uniref:Lipid-binding transport protein (Tim44 family) n=1 Tax=Rhizobium herbae TaxID=508661 RepID=A0ABS4EJR8_9HYPH|nr:Tim44 domain-containing protein [Rhizobium herbae]MBP1858192.1 putative lipid-binding transport protein (Tim44 family) [Rhizobium herbae]
MVRFGRVLATFAVASMVMLTVVDLAEARRAGSGFGSRGTRTFSQPPITRTAPADATPINRTMTPQNQATPGAAQQNTAARPGAQRPGGLFGGFAGSMLGGLALGGLIGMMMGTGFGGAAGMLGMLLQMALIAGAVMLALRFFRGRQTAAPAGYAPRGAGSSPMQGFGQGQNSGSGSGMPSFKIPSIGGGALSGGAARPAQPRMADDTTDEIGVGEADLGQFETMLKQVQAAYAAEDYGTLRKLTTPEAMSWLAEELSDNATKGLKNEVRDVHLVQGDVSEAWNEGGDDYATVAMRYESIDVTRERATGRVVEGDPDQPTESVELWTFLRKRGGDWQVSAIQGMAA